MPGPTFALGEDPGLSRDEPRGAKSRHERGSAWVHIAGKEFVSVEASAQLRHRGFGVTGD
jgi:hypothetical protein